MVTVTRGHSTMASIRQKCFANFVCRLSISDDAERNEQNQRDYTKQRFPYGVSDWARIVAQQSFYADKTKAIRDLEEWGNFCKIWRPRRSGKSLFCRQLEIYYDIAVDEDKVNLWT